MYETSKRLALALVVVDLILIAPDIRDGGGAEAIAIGDGDIQVKHIPDGEIGSIVRPPPKITSLGGGTFIMEHETPARGTRLGRRGK
jgi:hypothetical protein